MRIPFNDNSVFPTPILENLTVLSVNLHLILNTERSIVRNMALISPLTAAEMAAKSHEARRRNKELRIMDEPEPQPMPQIADKPEQAEVKRVREQLESLNLQIDSCTDPDEWDALTRSKERLFRIWARLAQLPMDPKPAVVKTRSQSYPTLDPRPIEPIAQSVSQPQAQPQSQTVAKPGA